MANVTFKFLKKTNLEIGYSSSYSDDKTDFTLFENDEETLNMTDGNGLYFGVFGNDEDILTTPIIYTTVNGVTYSLEFYKNSSPYEDTKYYLPIRYYQKHYSTGIECVEIGASTDPNSKLVPYSSDMVFNVDCGGKGGQIDFEENTISNAIGIYSITNDQLVKFLSDRYKLVEMGNYGNIYDVSKDIIKLYKSPLNNLVFEDTELVTAGGKSLNITCPFSKRITVTHETQNIRLSGLYGNALDKDTIIKLIIPFFGVYNLDSKYINHNLKLQFTTNLLNNNSVCYIYIDDVIIDNINYVCGYDIPYINNNVNSDITNNKFMTELYIAFEDKIKIADVADTLKLNTNLHDEVFNNGLSGFVKCDKIKTNSFNNIPDEDINNIIAILQDYIFI